MLHVSMDTFKVYGNKVVVQTKKYVLMFGPSHLDTIFMTVFVHFSVSRLMQIVLPRNKSKDVSRTLIVFCFSVKNMSCYEQGDVR